MISASQQLHNNYIVPITKVILRIFTAHARNGHISTSDLRTFSVVFFIGEAKSPPYFYFRFIWPTDLESVPRVEPPTLIISTKFFRRVTALLVRIRYVSLWPWPFNLGQWSNMAGLVGNPSTTFQDPTPMRSWLMSSGVRHRPPLTMRLEPLRMRRITWPVRRGQIFTKYLKSLTPICLFTMQPPWLYDQDKLSYLPK